MLPSLRHLLLTCWLLAAGSAGCGPAEEQETDAACEENCRQGTLVPCRNNCDAACGEDDVCRDACHGDCIGEFDNCVFDNCETRP